MMKRKKLEGFLTPPPTTMTYDSRELHDLDEHLIEESLTADQFDRLKEILKSDQAALEAHVDYLFNHAALSLVAEEDAKQVADTQLVEAIASLEQAVAMPCVYRLEKKPKRLGRLLMVPAVAVFLCLSATLAALSLTGFFRGPAEFVTIAETTNCLWNDSSVITSPGTRIGACVLNLEKGIALLRFDNGVLVSLEGPCVFEIKNNKYTILHSGGLVATVETKEGNGFVVDTPHAAIKDFGTKFGVQTSQKKQTSVFVIEGNVEVAPKDALDAIPLEKGQSIAIEAPGDIQAVESEPVSSSQIEAVQFSSASGQGNEAWVVNKSHTIETALTQFPGGVTDAYMLVKLSKEEDAKSDRKALFRIDLDSFDRKDDILGATIHLAYGPTGIGYATYISDATFTIYGLIEETGDMWQETNLDWEQLPGNDKRNEMLPTHWKPLGNFTIRRGNPSGAIQIKSDALCQFIRNDTNNLLSFAIVCDTPAEETFGLVFGFANRNHGTLSPPRLNITLKRKTERTAQ